MVCPICVATAVVSQVRGGGEGGVWRAAPPCVRGPLACGASGAVCAPRSMRQGRRRGRAVDPGKGERAGTRVAGAAGGVDTHFNGFSPPGRRTSQGPFAHPFANAPPPSAHHRPPSSPPPPPPPWAAAPCAKRCCPRAPRRPPPRSRCASSAACGRPQRRRAARPSPSEGAAPHTHTYTVFCLLLFLPCFNSTNALVPLSLSLLTHSTAPTPATRPPPPPPAAGSPPPRPPRCPPPPRRRRSGTRACPRPGCGRRRRRK